MGDLIDQHAKKTNATRAEAAESVQEVVDDIIAKLRSGKPVKLPGIGKLLPGPKPGFRFEPSRKGKGR